ncbi:tetratricopeptide repeat protein [Labilibacter marinus]|uniref:tetratricopeptide repeat protein n=1 Tax=Labilibacter marinus TaxID=1477105 RepID=UPI00117B20CA|nr:hypothetical protein [Labilibacter marinus]
MLIILPPYMHAVGANNLKQEFRSADSIFLHHPDSAFTPYQNLYNLSKEAKDTSSQILCLRRMGKISYQQKKLPEALNFYTEALHLSDLKKSIINKASVLADLGNLYCKYGHFDDGEDYIMQAHRIFLTCMKENKIGHKTLIYSYIHIAELNIQRELNQNAIMYLDTCLLLANAYDNSEEEEANILRLKSTALTAMDSLNQALEILLPLEKQFDLLSITTSNYTYHYSNAILISWGIGVIYSKQEKDELALQHLFKSLHLIKRLQKKLDHQTKVLNEIATIYKRQKKYDLAFKYQDEAYKYTEKNLTSNSERNKGVLKIRNTYIEKLDEKEKEIMAKNLMLANKDKANLRLRIVILVFAIFIVAFGFLYWTRSVKNRLRSEKQGIQEKAAEKEKVSQLELRYKNRELTTSSLQLIERDDLLDKFTSYLDKDKNTEAKSLKFARKQLASNLWEEFEKRFVSIHQGFYERLTKQFPELTTNDLKLCALVKLDLKGKEISRLLGMTEKSVHTARYRIRKKINLETNASLEEFMKKV